MARFSRKNEDVINSSLSELILFLFFFFLIMLATIVSSTTAPGKTENDRMRELMAQLNQAGLHGRLLDARLKTSIAEVSELKSDLRGVTFQFVEQRQVHIQSMTTMSDERAALTRQVSVLMATNSQLKKEAQDKDTDIESLVEEIERLNLELVEENRRRLNIQGRFEELRTSFLDLLSDFAFLAPLSEGSQSLGVAAREFVEDLLVRVGDLEDDVRKRTALLDALSAKLKQWSAELDAHRNLEVSQENGAIENQAQLTEVVSERDNLELQLGNEQKKNEDLLALVYDENDGLLPAAQADIRNLEEQVVRLISELRRREQQIEELRAEAVVTKWPASLDLSDDDGYRFDSGSYVPSDEFLERFREKGILELMNRLEELEGEISVIEVLGHTDEQFLNSSGTSNLDEELIAFVSESSANAIDEWKKLNPKDNAGLGLARAAAITVLIKNIVKTVYPDIKVLPLSAGQLLEKSASGSILADPPVNNSEDRSRRRIEIRFRG